MRLAAFLLLLASAGASAQTATEARSSWLALGFGPTTGRDGRGMMSIGVRVVAPVGSGRVVVQGGASMAENTRSLLARPSEKTFQGHLAVGVAGRRGPVHVAAVAGPSIGHATLFRNDGPVGGATGVVEMARYLPGAYGSVQAVVALSSGFGVSAEAFGQANADLPTAGVRVGVVVGNL